MVSQQRRDGSKQERKTMTNQFATGFVKQAQGHGLSPIEAEALLEKYANQMGSMLPQGGGQPPQHPSAGGPGAQVTVNGRPLPPELSHLVMQILQKLISAGGQQAAGQGHPGM